MPGRGSRALDDNALPWNSCKFIRTSKFSLKFLGSAIPSVSIVPVLNHKRDASLDVGADRQDIHQLILTMERPEQVAGKGPRGAGRDDMSGTSTRGVLGRLDQERPEAESTGLGIGCGLYPSGLAYHPEYSLHAT